ncbi:response regulator transcription factor [Phenylobacterium sp.]|uniref:LuxR C-terminal-related transcriptional regulator n=1 Tax=Phenylobacterium sp. TaxID=1871053 RepID=UPI0025D8BA32|nr:response regulator transcription factor [Phenylobacterium sp.]MBX3484555.1 response regulator transcription factor [Phenylobacterium sp.]
MPSVVVADDHPLMLEAISGLLGGADFEVVARGQDGAQACAAIVERRPDLALLDVNMPGMTGIEILRQARAEGWPTRILLLTAGLDPEPIMEALRLRVDGLVLKGAGGEIILRAARSVLDGVQWIDRAAMDQVAGLIGQAATAPTPLTPRETDVVRRVAQGRRNKEIARDLGISEGTVKMHLHNLYEKLGVSSRTELAMLARDRGIG